MRITRLLIDNANPLTDSTQLVSIVHESKG